jgi:hypothetical protein
MLRITTCCFLVALLTMEAFPALAAERTVAEQSAGFKPGRKIKVELNSGEILKGRMGSIGADRLTLEPANAAHGTARVVQFNDARSVKPGGLTTGQKWLIFGGVWIAVGIIAGSPV